MSYMFRPRRVIIKVFHILILSMMIALLAETCSPLVTTYCYTVNILCMMIVLPIKSYITSTEPSIYSYKSMPAFQSKPHPQIIIL